MEATEGHGVDIDFSARNWEEEAGTLLDWSQNLDYDAYMDDWATIGTSQDPTTMVPGRYRDTIAQAGDEEYTGYK